MLHELAQPASSNFIKIWVDLSPDGVRVHVAVEVGNYFLSRPLLRKDLKSNEMVKTNKGVSIINYSAEFICLIKVPTPIQL